MSPGIYIYPFETELATNLPTSCEGKHGFIRYLASANIIRPNATTQTQTIAFTVIKPLNLNALPVVQVRRANNDLSGIYLKWLPFLFGLFKIADYHTWIIIFFVFSFFFSSCDCVSPVGATLITNKHRTNKKMKNKSNSKRTQITTLQCPIQKQQTIKFFQLLSMKLNNLTITATIPTSGYAPGQMITIDLGVNNKSNCDITNFKIVLNKVTYRVFFCLVLVHVTHSKSSCTNDVNERAQPVQLIMLRVQRCLRLISLNLFQ